MKTEGQTPREKNLSNEVRIGFRMGGIGMEVTSQVIAGALMGWLFDRWQNTAPKGAFTGAIIGIVVGLWSLIRGTLKLNRELEKHHPPGPSAPPAGRGTPIPPDDQEEKDKENDPDHRFEDQHK